VYFDMSFQTLHLAWFECLEVKCFLLKPSVTPGTVGYLL